MGDLIEHPGSNTGALIAQDPEAVAKLREQRLQEVRHGTVWQQLSCAAVCCKHHAAAVVGASTGCLTCMLLFRRLKC
jgi:hypothetical protein